MPGKVVASSVGTNFLCWLPSAMFNPTCYMNTGKKGVLPKLSVLQY